MPDPTQYLAPGIVPHPHAHLGALHAGPTTPTPPDSVPLQCLHRPFPHLHALQAFGGFGGCCWQRLPTDVLFLVFSQPRFSPAGLPLVPLMDLGCVSHLSVPDLGSSFVYL